MPSLRQIDPIEIPKLLPIILIADILPGDRDNAAVGNGFDQRYGRETRGRDVTN